MTQLIRPELAILEERPVDTIVGREPSWIVRSGITLISIVFVVLLILTWFISYPDTISARVVVTTKQPPAELISRVDARILELFVADKQSVNAGDHLLLLESSIDYQKLTLLEKKLVFLRQGLISGKIEKLDTADLTSTSTSLGELQSPFNQLFSSLKEYFTYIESKRFFNQISSSQILYQRHQKLNQQLLNKKDTWQRKLEIEKNKLSRNRKLNQQGIVPDSAIAPLESQYLDQQISLDDINIQLELNNIKSDEIKNSLIDYKVQHQEQQQRLFAKISQNLLLFNSKVLSWKQKYLFVAPITGRVSFSNFWSINQQIKRGDTALSVVKPVTELIGKVSVHHLGAGKIKLDQRVNIELDSFPSVEFGKLTGVVSAISIVPDHDGYKLDIKLEQGLLTSYHKKLTYTPNLVGTATIITQERRLIERVFNKIIYSTQDI